MKATIGDIYLPFVQNLFTVCAYCATINLKIVDLYNPEQMIVKFLCEGVCHADTNLLELD